MKFGTHQTFGIKNWEGNDLKARIAKASEIGFDTFELTPFDFLHGNRQDGLVLADYAHSKNVELVFCCGFPQDCDMVSDDEEIRENGVKYMREMFKLMKEMDVHMLVGALYGYWPSYRSTILDPNDKIYIMKRTAEYFKRAAEDADKYDCNCAIECLNRFEHWLINTGEECSNFVDMVNNPRVGVHLDTFHMNIEEASIKDAVLNAGSRLKALHLAERNRALPGTSDFLWDDFFGALKQVGFDGYMDIESFIVTGGTVCADIALWRDLTGGKSVDELDDLNAQALAFMKSKSREYGLI